MAFLPSKRRSSVRDLRGKRRPSRARVSAPAGAWFEALEARRLLAFRSVQVTFHNFTNYPLRLVKLELESANEWTNGVQPALDVAPGETVTWESESNGFNVGTEARATYRIATTGLNVVMHWDDPAEGSNSYDDSAPDGFTIFRDGGDGDNAQVTWTLREIDNNNDDIPDVWETQSYGATFTNNTESALVLVDSTLNDGAWLSSFQSPPARIEPGQTEIWSARSNYYPPQVDGHVIYELEGTPFTFSVNWNVPVNFPPLLQDTFTESAPAGFAITADVSGTDEARVHYNASIIDSDGDGIPDDWETNGINYNGTVYKIPGADPNHKDVYVEADAMSQDLDHNGTLNITNEAAIGQDVNLDGTKSPGTRINEDLRPAPGALQAVANAFAAAPVPNPDGTTGVRLHFDGGTDGVDDGDIPLASWGSATSANPWPGFAAVKAKYFGTQAERSSPNAANLLAAKALVYRYAVFAEQQGATTTPPKTPGGTATISPDTHSGRSEILGNDLMVTLGTWNTPGGTPEQQEGTFMHELGHSLGLGHGGGDGANFKPNYDSVMNYLWTDPASWMTKAPDGTNVPSIWRLDYSRTAFPTLSEAHLDETKGIQGTPGRFVPIGPYTNPQTVWETGPVDWDGDNDNGTETDVSSDVNWFGDTNGDGTTDSKDASPDEFLDGYDDWSNLIYNFRRSSQALDGIHNPPDSDDPEDLQTFQYLNGDTMTRLTASPNPSNYGQSVTFTATVAANSGATLGGGSVRFFDGAILIGTVPLSGSTATFSTTLLTAGTHTISASYDGSGFYQPSTSPDLTETVNRAKLTVSAADATRTYGDPNPAFSGTIVGLQNGDPITATYSTTATQSSDVGTYPIIPILIDPSVRADNYDITVNNGTLTITKAHLTVTADDQTKIFRAPNPPLTATITGFVFGQTLVTSGVTGTPALVTSATADSAVGTYPITVAVGTLSAKNYDFTTFVPGKLFITYGIKVDFDTDKAYNPDATIPVKIELVDFYGNNVSSDSIGVHALDIAPVDDPSTRLPALSAGGSQAGNDFRYTGGTYHFNLKNTGRAARRYTLAFSVDGDPLVHTVAFLLG